MISDHDREWLKETFEEILSAAIDRDADAMADGIGEVGLRLGHDGIYAVCCGMASAVQQLAFPDFVQGDGTLAGDIAVADKLTDGADHPPTLWAVRFTVAYMNGDSKNTLALFWGPLENDSAETPADEILIPAVVELIRLAADLARHKEAELS